MPIMSAIAQLRTTDLEESIRFYTTKVGLTLAFRAQDFYAGIRAGNQLFHLKLVDEKDPSIAYVEDCDHFHLYLETDDAAAAAEALERNGVCLVRGLHETAWGTVEFVIKDDRAIPRISASIDRPDPAWAGAVGTRNLGGCNALTVVPGLGPGAPPLGGTVDFFTDS